VQVADDFYPRSVSDEQEIGDIFTHEEIKQIVVLRRVNEAIFWLPLLLAAHGQHPA